MPHRRRVAMLVAVIGLGAAVWPGHRLGAQEAPVITAISPATGPTSGGTVVTLTGSGLGAIAEIRFGDFGDSRGNDLQVNADGTALTVITPPAPAGPVTVDAVTTAGAQSGPAFDFAWPDGGQSAPPAWIVMSRSVAAYARIDPPTVTALLNRPQTYVVIGSSPSACSDPALSTVPEATPTAIFSSYTAFAEVMSRQALPSCIKTVLHDPEAWDFTPTDEQTRPDLYAQRFAELAHQHGLTVIEAPAQSLTETLGQDPGETRWQAYLRHGLAATAARYSDIAEFQIQGAEADYRDYSQVLNAFTSQARSAGSSAVIVAGLATNPNGQEVTAEQIFQSALTALGQVAGFWLNDSRQWDGCPQCTGPYPDRAVAFLRYVSRG